jgi:hypothetical protein
MVGWYFDVVVGYLIRIVIRRELLLWDTPTAFLVARVSRRLCRPIPSGSDVMLRVKRGEPEVSIVCDEDQSPGRLGRK